MSKIILFQGDSITDCGRREDVQSGLGGGYPKLIADYFAKTDESIKVINRGISGNRVVDLVARWQEDCINLQPDVLTILIGINDCWRKYDRNDPTTTEAFEAGYDAILAKTRAETSAQIILMEPFVLPEPADRIIWRETLDPQIQAVRRLAKKYFTKLVTLDGIFAQESIIHGYEELSKDGVHPTLLGHEVIMEAWLEVYKRL